MRCYCLSELTGFQRGANVKWDEWRHIPVLPGMMDRVLYRGSNVLQSKRNRQCFGNNCRWIVFFHPQLPMSGPGGRSDSNPPNAEGNMYNKSAIIKKSSTGLNVPDWWIGGTCWQSSLDPFRRVAQARINTIQRVKCFSVIILIAN